MNEIEALLTDAAKSGRQPTDDEIKALWRRGNGGDRATATRAVRRALKEIVGLERGELASTDDPDVAIAEIIAGAAEKYSHLTASSEVQHPSRELADRIQRAAASPEGVETRRRAAMAARQRRSELVDLLKGAGKAGGIDGRDLDALNLRAELTAAERDEWRAAVVAAGDRVGRLWTSGNLGQSRQLADELGARLADQLAPTGQDRDPLRDEEDPRALADAIVARSRG